MGSQPKLERSDKKLLIVERKLVSNRGHHHTQVAALKSFLPTYEAHLLTGDDYDGFLGPATGRISQKDLTLARIGTKIRHGNFLTGVTSRFSLLKNGKIRVPGSAYGKTLADICRHQHFGPQDLIVIPTADLDSLESSIEASRALGKNSPNICLRFLNAELGERKMAQRDKRISVANDLPANISLFSETEELAAYLNNRFPLSVTGGFFMPCSILASEPSSLLHDDDRCMRVGVFGPPRPEKGSARLANIISALVGRIGSSKRMHFDFLVQGSPKDFGTNGVYSALGASTNGSTSVKVTPIADRISPPEFGELFKSVDMILLPYDPSIYSLQGSGVIQDSISALKPIIYTKGMSMQSLLSHGNAVAAVSDDDFADSMMHVGDNLQGFSSGVEAAAQHYQYQLKNSPFIRSLGLA
jgi:hypothetical protein